MPTDQPPKRKKPQPQPKPDDLPISRSNSISTPTNKHFTSSELRMKKLRSIDTMPDLRKAKSTPKLRKAAISHQLNSHVEPQTIQIGNDNTGSAADNQNENGVALAGGEGEGEGEVCEDKAAITFTCSSLDHKTPEELPDNDEPDETLEEENDQESSSSGHVKQVMVAAVDEAEAEPREKAENVDEQQRKQQSPSPSPTLLLLLPIQQPKDTLLYNKKIANTNISRPSSSSTVHHNYNYAKFGETHHRLQSLVDLVMWRDVSRSAFVFGIGAFAIISSSYTKDLNISFITVLSYLGLLYLAAIFLYRSIFCRGNVEEERSGGGEVVGEEEALWLLKLLLPYLNEFLWKLKALFSGDPSTTMKLAVLLFVMARCGSSITIWKLAKLGFFGVFTVPKVCSSYSTQISAFGKFWIRRFQDAWEGCSHKKAVAFAIFALVWNLSSVVARFWTAFMMFVALRYYQQQQQQQQSDWSSKDKGGANGPRRGYGATISQPAKPKERKTS